MQDGLLKEFGTPKELLESKESLFAQMAKASQVRDKKV
jgi:hypothetical protein